MAPLPHPRSVAKQLGALASLALLSASVAHAQDAAPAPIGFGSLPRDLSPWGMILHADIVVQAVMAGLAFASVITWTVWLAKSLELTAAKRRARSGLRALANATSFVEATQNANIRFGVTYGMVQATNLELRLSADVDDKEGIKERVASRLERIEAAAGRRIARGTSILGTIGATAPFVGLFGTVWGIMNSFIGISKLNTTSLAVVAPGIADALLATAFGLIAAIPAVMIYNAFARSIGAYRASLGDASAEILRLVSRDLDRQATQGEREDFSAAAE